MNFLVERELDRIARGFESRFWRIDPRDHHASAGIDNVFDKAQGVTFLFLRLPEKMLRKLGQCFRRKMRRNRIILQLRAEFVPDLLVYRIDDFLTG